MILVATALVSVVATPMFAAYGRRIGLVVKPRADRWSTRATPLLGGAGIALAAMVAIAILLPPSRTSLFILLAAVAAFGLGLLDDFRHIAPATKLVGQVIVAALLIVGGVRVEIIDVPGVSFLLTALWIVGMMNAVNLIDNMDGLAAGIAVIGATVLGVTAIGENSTAVTLAAITAGASLGFLFHNFYPARVFMGDAGSLTLGMLLATAALTHTASGASNLGLAVLGPLAVLMLPLFDTALVATARRVARRPVSQGGRDHTSHRLAALGLSDRSAVLLLYVVAGLLGGIGLALDAVGGLGLALAALGVVGLALFGVFLFEVDVYGRAAVPQDGGPSSAVARGIATYGRFGLEVGLDVLLLTTAYYVAHLIRFEGQPEAEWRDAFVRSLPIVVGAQLAALATFGVYRTLWRHLSIADAMAILRAILVGTGVAALGFFVVVRFQGYSRAVFLADGILAGTFVFGSRWFLLLLRHYFQTRPRQGERRVLIVGGNDTGALLLRLLGRSTQSAYRVVGFLDDDPGKRHRRISGVPIVGRVDELSTAGPRLGADLVIVALDPPDEDLARRIRLACEELGTEWRQFSVPV